VRKRHQNVVSWIESSRTGLRTKSAQRLADAALAMTSQQWHEAVMRRPSPDESASSHPDDRTG
jgi:hypothetical protein